MTKTFKKSVAFLSAAVMVMAMLLYFPSGTFSNIDWGLTALAEENTAEGYTNGFCNTYTEGTECSKHGTDCNGYQPATETTDQYDIDDDNIKDTVYEIGNAGQLYWFAALVNGTDNLSQDLDANAILTDNIKINDDVLVGGELNSDTDVVKGFRKWTPIGMCWFNYSGDRHLFSYTGTFDGCNYTIRGLYYSENANNDAMYAGLFGFSKGSISNIIIKDSYFSLTNTGKESILGALVGGNGGTIKNCKTYSVVDFNGKYCYIGGLCGTNSSNDSSCISECTNYGKIKGVFSEKSFIGGVLGFNNNKIENCNNEGNVNVTNDNAIGDYVGGICGYNNGYIKGCHNSGAVDGYIVGGVCGSQEQYDSSSRCGTITNCYNTGTVKGTSQVGGICGFNPGTIENCYSAGSVSGSSCVGGVCGYNGTYFSLPEGTNNIIRNCYFVKATDSDKAIGSNDSDAIVAKVEGKTLEDFEEGEVCYLLNNRKTDDTLVWYQTLDTDSYPLLDNSHGTVYACTPCTGVFSNISGQTAEHSYVVDTNDSTNHICKNCGKYSHKAVFKADDETNTISVCCDLGSVTLKAPTEPTYDGTAKAATVEGKLTGIETPKILYKLKDSAEEAVETAPTNAGTYLASITYKDADSTEHSVSVEYTIAKATPVGDTARNINVVSGVGEFTEPNFTGVDGKPLDGYVKYDILSYDQQVEYLKTFTNAKVNSGYTFIPKDENYNNVTGPINFIIRDVEFKVGNDKATAANAVTVKNNPTYGDTWADILTLKDGLKAVLPDETVTTGFSLDVTGSPNAGNNQEYNVLFNGTIGGKTFTDHIVATGTVDVAPKLLTVSAGTYKVSKVYDGKTEKGTGSGTLSVSGIINNRPPRKLI